LNLIFAAQETDSKGIILTGGLFKNERNFVGVKSAYKKLLLQRK
jgi:hypothetical protein